MSAPAFVALTERGAVLARKIAASFPGAAVHGLDRRVANPDLAFSDTTSHLRAQIGRAHV